MAGARYDAGLTHRGKVQAVGSGLSRVAERRGERLATPRELPEI